MPYNTFMNHTDHVRLLRKGIPQNAGGIWADFGSGEGAFTLALSDLAGEQATIYSIDKDKKSLTVQKDRFAEMFPGSNISFIAADFTQPLSLPTLDGLIAANSIHFEKDTIEVLHRLVAYLKPNGKIVIVEYNVDKGNTWVPYPFSFTSLIDIAKSGGLPQPTLLDTEPSSFLNEIYSAEIQLRN
jgi:ubiquinone/menaquinone biosynthesis C-methylase UbiE